MEQENIDEKPKHRYRLKAKIISLPSEIQVPINASELMVLTKAKDLISYIFCITQNSPKKFRFTFVGKLQSLSLDLIENLIRANETLIKKGDFELYKIRNQYQKQANITLKLLEYFALLAFENKCILIKQYEQIAKKGNECKILLTNWIKSDKSRV